MPPRDEIHVGAGVRHLVDKRQIDHHGAWVREHEIVSAEFQEVPNRPTIDIRPLTKHNNARHHDVKLNVFDRVRFALE